MSEPVDRAKLEVRLAKYSRHDPSGCVLWCGAINGGGYGILTWQGRCEKAHRMAWVAHHARPVPAGLMVCHRCDRRRCINPLHLFLGTALDNNRDRASKGRSRTPVGEAHHSARLTAEDVIAIRASSLSLRALAARYGVSNPAINQIRQRRTWRHI